MAIKDSFSGTNAVSVTGASTTAGDLLDFNSAAIVFISGTSPSVPLIEESDDGSSYSQVADADLLRTIADGSTIEGLPVLVDDTDQLIRYRGVARYVRASATNATTLLLRNYPARSAAVGA